MMPDDDAIKAQVQEALREDVGSGDITAALLPADLMVRAEIYSRESMVVCGQAWVNRAFFEVDPSVQVQWLVEEGAFLEAPQSLGVILGPARSVLTAERTALNFLQTLSGTATMTREYVLQLQGTSTQLLDTRKTLPGLRMAQKYAVTCGGGVNHRFGLFDAFLIKENHIKAYGSIRAVIEHARRMHPERFLEIEVETLAELQEALDAKPDRVLLDNFNEAMMREAVAMNQPKQVMLEASGGVTQATMKAIALTGVDFISVGMITKSIRAIDLSLLVQDAT
jgi:nicotinate-nucleotide pyrophosphorylase (carboxylating)